MDEPFCLSFCYFTRRATLLYHLPLSLCVCGFLPPLRRWPTHFPSRSCHILKLFISLLEGRIRALEWFHLINVYFNSVRFEWNVLEFCVWFWLMDGQERYSSGERTRCRRPSATPSSSSTGSTKRCASSSCRPSSTSSTRPTPTNCPDSVSQHSPRYLSDSEVLTLLS